MKISPDSVPDVVHIDSEAPGPRVVIFGGMHGDEVSGAHAIEKLLSDFSSGTRTLVSGTLVTARVSGPALAANKRYITIDPNGLYTDIYGADVDTTTDEYRRAQELKPFLTKCDYFLDLHSAPIAQEPFLLCEADQADFFRQLGLAKMIVGWGKFDDELGGAAETYAYRHGAKATTFEAGGNTDPAAIEVAYNAAVTLLSLLGMIAPIQIPNHVESETFEMYHVQTKESEDFKYVPEVKNFLFVAKGSPYAYQNNSPLLAPEDSYLLIPMKPEITHVGEEVCYLGRKV